MKPYLFTYGTLRTDAPNRSQLVQLLGNFIGAGTIKGTLYDLGHYPGVVGNSQQPVHGQVFEVSEESILRFDRYEGCPNLYTREWTEAILADGQKVNVWYYAYNKPISGHATHIPNGDYVSYLKEHRNDECCK